MMLEKEKKILLSKEQYILLLQIIEWTDYFVQINFYYDDKKQNLRKSNMTIRIRGKGDKLNLQIKIKQNRLGNRIISREYKKEVSEIPYLIKKEDLYEWFQIEIEDDVILTGFMQTARRTKKLRDGVKLFLDLNTYSEIEDYELDIDYESD